MCRVYRALPHAYTILHHLQVQLKELSVNTAQVLQLNRKLEQQVAAANKKQQASTKECEALRSDLKAAHDLTQEANTLLTEQERYNTAINQSRACMYSVT